MQVPKDIFFIKDRFEQAGKELFLVGGCVRDHLMGLEPKDFDMATDATPTEIEEILDGYMMDHTGKSFGVMRVRTEKGSLEFEIATYRKDLTFGRKPTVRIGATMQDDANRRDLTMNAVYWDIKKNVPIDLVNGLADIKSRIIRTPGNPMDRFNEDKLRMLRAIRFKSRINGSYDPELEVAISSNGILIGLDHTGNLVPISQERMIDELLKGIQQANKVKEYLFDLQRFGMLEQILKWTGPFGPFVESRIPEFVIARLLTFMKFYVPEESKKLIDKFVYECNLTSKMANGIMLLLELERVSEESVTRLEKLLKKTSLNKSMILEYLDHLKELGPFTNEENIRAFAKYSFSVNSSELMAQGFNGQKLGQEIERLEVENFIKIKTHAK